MTRDGSPTLESHRWGCAFHSRHGALTEALHVYLQEGLAHAAAEVEGPLRILEMGAGTGFNAALALDWAQRQGRELHYTGIDVALPEYTKPGKPGGIAGHSVLAGWMGRSASAMLGQRVSAS